MLLEIPARYPLSKPVNILIIPFLSKERSFPRWDIAHIIVSDLDWFGRGFGSWSAILLIVTNLPACINSEIEMKSCPASKTQNRWDRKGKSFPHFLTVCLLLKWMLPPKGKDRGESKQIYPSKNPPKLFAYWIPHLLPTISPFDRFLEQFSNPPPPHRNYSLLELVIVWCLPNPVGEGEDFPVNFTSHWAQHGPVQPFLLFFAKSRAVLHTFLALLVLGKVVEVRVGWQMNTHKTPLEDAATWNSWPGYDFGEGGLRARELMRQYLWINGPPRSRNWKWFLWMELNLWQIEGLRRCNIWRGKENWVGKFAVIFNHKAFLS